MLSAPAPPAQALLAELLAERVAWVTGQVSAVPARPGAAETTVLVLLRSLCLSDVAYGAREFAAALDADEAAAWRRSWTRTRFLFGNPANLAPQNRARVIGHDGTAAWLGPFPDARLPGLSRLLKPITGELPDLPDGVDLPGTGTATITGTGTGTGTGNGVGNGVGTGRGGRRRVLRIAVGGLTLVDYLVHLHHTLAEAVLLGRLRPDEPLRLCHVPELGPDPDPRHPPAYARVLPEPGGTGRLRPYTWLSST